MKMSMRGYWAIPVLASILILGTFSFTIPPSFAVPDFDSMRAAIESLGLPKGTENSLVSKINTAQKQFENGNDEAATNILDAFKNYVNAQSRKMIDSIDADSLIDSVQEIIDEILGVAPPIQCPQPQGFDIFPDGTVPTGGFAVTTQVTSEWAACGIALLTSTDPGGPQIFNFATTGKSPPNILAGCDEFDDVLLECGSQQFFQPIGVEFTDPVSSASIKGLGIGCRGLILDGYNSANVLVDTDSVVHSSSGANNVDLLSISGSDIMRLDIHQKFPFLVCGFVLDGYGIDDLSYIFE